MALFKSKESFISPLSGNILPLNQVPDPVFAQKMMGDGFAIELTENKVIAPFSGEITVVFPTGHAYGIKTKQGYEILIHIGLDTVELNGQGFEILVKPNQQVKQADTLALIDLDFISKKQKSLVSPIIFTSGETITLLQSNKYVALGTKDIIKIK